MKNVFFKIRNNWKKVCFFGVISLGGARYLHQLYSENQIVKAYCLNAQKYGDLKISPHDDPRKVFVLLDETNDKYRHSTFKYYNNYVAPILHSAGVLVDIIKISNDDFSTHLKDSVIDKELPYFIKQISATNIQYDFPFSSNSNQSLGVIILGSENIVSGFVKYLKTISNSDFCKIIKKIQFAWIDFGVSESKFFKTKWSSYKPISSTLISNLNFLWGNPTKQKCEPKTNDVPLYNLTDTALGIGCNGYQMSYFEKDVQNDPISKVSAKLINLVEIHCEKFDNKADQKTNDILCDNKLILENDACFFQQVDIGNNDTYFHNVPYLWGRKMKDVFALHFDKDILYQIKQIYYELKHKISSTVKDYKSPDPFDAEITFWYNPCAIENPCSACHTNTLTFLQTFYKLLGVSKFLDYFYPKESLPISPHHKHPETSYLETTHITAKFRPDSENTDVQIIGYPSQINSIQALENVISEANSISASKEELAYNLLHLYKEDVKHIEIKIIKHNNDDRAESDVNLNSESRMQSAPEDHNLSYISKKIDMEILPHTFNILHKNVDISK